MCIPKTSTAWRVFWPPSRLIVPVPLLARIAQPDGTWRRISFELVVLDERNRLLVMRDADTTDQQASTRTVLLQQVRYDTITGLPNRVLFLDRLERAVERAQRDTDYMCAILYLDVDRFKVVNDSFGQSIGDQLLRVIAQRLTACLRTQDTIAWLGSDEFGIIINGFTTIEEVQAFADSIHEQFVAPLDLNRHEIVVTTSIGIAVDDGSYSESENLLRDADTALHRAKTLGKARSNCSTVACTRRLCICCVWKASYGARCGTKYCNCITSRSSPSRITVSSVSKHLYAGITRSVALSHHSISSHSPRKPD